MTIFNVISLAGGLALFLYGMRIMGDGLKHGSSEAFRKAMEKVTNNPFVGFLLGMVVTGVIQSSTATIVITSGLVGAGIITLHQSLGIILGANVGTTMTGQIIRLLDISGESASWLTLFKPSTLAPIAAVIGILLIMAFRFKSSDTAGTIAMGFAILFTGLLNMTQAVSPLGDSPAFSQLFVSLSHNPVLGFLAGAGVAFSIQSSSATIGILQALSLTGKLTFSSIYSIIVGIYLGDCVTTAIVCSIGAKADAKRTGMVHILFNLSEAVLVFTAVTILHRTGLLDKLWDVPITSGGIANVHTLFNLCCALLLLPVCSGFEKLSRVIIKDAADPAGEQQVLNDKLFASPALALASVHETIQTMADLACAGVDQAMAMLGDYDSKADQVIQENEDRIDALADSVNGYLVRLAAHMDSDDNNNLLNYYMQCFVEFERIGDYAVNLTENAQEMQQKGCSFSPTALKELDLLRQALNQILDYAQKTFRERSPETARHIEPIEEVVDGLVVDLRNHHGRRLREGVCSVAAGLTFVDILTNVERISDQCSNLGVYTVALSDTAVMSTHHDYIRHLHQGEDAGFNAEYQAACMEYYSRLDAIETLES